MDVLDCIRADRATRSFADRPVDDETVETVIDAARRAGSGKNRQPWTFVAIRDPEALERLASFGTYTTPLREAPVGIAILVDDRETEAGRLGNAFDCGRASQNLMLAATSLGLGTVPQSVGDAAGAGAFLSVPDDKRVRIIIALGYPAVEPDDHIEGVPKEEVLGSLDRKPLDDVLHWERHR